MQRHWGGFTRPSEIGEQSYLDLQRFAALALSSDSCAPGQRPLIRLAGDGPVVNLKAEAGDHVVGNGDGHHG